MRRSRLASTLSGRGAALLALAWFALGCAASGPTPKPAPKPAQGSAPLSEADASEGPAFFWGFELLGEAVISAGVPAAGGELGGLSSFAYDARRDVYYAVSDDPASRGPARFYTLGVDLSAGSLDSSKVEILGVTEILGPDGTALPAMTFDLEGLALGPEDGLFLSSEGQINQGVGPFLREYHLDGSFRRELELPEKFLPRPGEPTGIRHNLGFESVTLGPGGRWLFTATENALAQDGPAADVGVASPARILRLERATGRPVAEYVYVVEPVADGDLAASAFRTRGLVELIALGNDHLLTLERAYREGIGNTVELFAVSLDGATDVSRWPSLENRRFQPAQKSRLLPLDAFDIELDNLEGMTFGPRLPDGRATLLLIADNNFNPRQRIQILAFAIEVDEPSASRIQGRGHRSPLEGTWVRGLRGTVTSLAARGPGFWIQGPSDRDEATSDALLIVPESELAVAPGDAVVAAGLVRESGFPGELTVTRLDRADVEVVGDGAPLPVAAEIAGRRDVSTSEAGTLRIVPDHIDDDGLTAYEPTLDAIDFFESLEGMRVRVADSTVVGPTTRYGEFAVVTKGMVPADAVRSPAGGLVATGESTRSGPLLIVPGPGTEALEVAVGDHIEQPIVGVLDYGFGSFRILAEAPRAPTRRPRADIGATAGSSPGSVHGDRVLRLASYNVENLSARSDDEKYDRLARSIASTLDSPDILALQEIQDDTGPEDDGTVSAELTLGRLRAAIATAGGAVYEQLVIDPVDGADGGQPGANIRVAYLYRPDRIRFVARGMPQANSEAEWLVDERGPFLSPNPSRLDPDHPAFAADSEGNRTGSRKPLAAEFDFGGRRFFLVNVHLRSKRGDASPFGGVQPPDRPTEALRRDEATVIRDFLEQLLVLDPESLAIVLGDFNEHPYREPVRLFSESGFVNLVERLPRSERYTYVFRGVSQVLDNVLVTEGLARPGRSAVTVVHANADLPDSERASDHDPILLSIALPE